MPTKGNQVALGFTTEAVGFTDPWLLIEPPMLLDACLSISVLAAAIAIENLALSSIISAIAPVLSSSNTELLMSTSPAALIWALLATLTCAT